MTFSVCQVTYNCPRNDGVAGLSAPKIISEPCRFSAAPFVLGPDATKRRHLHVKNLSLPVVRRRSRGGREILCIAVAGFTDRNDPEEHRRWPRWKGRLRAGGGVRAGRPALHGAERRHAVRIYPRDLP